MQVTEIPDSTSATGDESGRASERPSGAAETAISLRHEKIYLDGAE